MDGPSTFVALATFLAALAVAAILPSLRRALAGHFSQRRAWLASAAFAFCFPALAFGVYGLRGDWAAAGGERGALSEQLLKDGLRQGGAAAAQMRVELERHLGRQPGDARALVLLARLEMREERYPQAAAAYEKALADGSKASKDAGVWVEYAEARSMAQGRSLLGEPQRLVQKALALDSEHPGALDLAGSAALERHDYAGAAKYWKRLLPQLPDGSERRAELSQAIARAEQRARFMLPELNELR